MGGKALKTIFGIQTKRISTDVYKILCQNLTNILSPFCKVRIIKSYRNKPTHGDIDVVCSFLKDQQPQNIKDWLQDLFQTKFIYKNDNCYSLFWKDVQIDLIFASPETFDAEVFFRDYSPFGNLVSRLLKQIDVSWKTTGLYYVFRYGSSFKKDIFLTNKPFTILLLAGLHFDVYEQGFLEEKDIFDYVCSSSLFRKEIYFLENLNHINRKRDAVREDYNRWNTYILNKPDNLKNPLSKEKNLLKLNNFFPHLILELEKCYTAILKQTETRMKFNGHLISAWTQLSGKELGQFMRVCSKTLDIESLSIKEIKTEVKKLYNEKYC